MKKNIRSELFFLKQYGFNDNTLQKLFLSKVDPLEYIFKKNQNYLQDLEINLSDIEIELAGNYKKYIRFKNNLFLKDNFLNDKESKIFFKYDMNKVTKIIPAKNMPLFIYTKGDTSLLDSDRIRVAIIGSRKPSNKSINITGIITQKFVNKNFVIVSGLAKGIDTISHKTTLLNNGKTIAILPTNFNKIYPSDNNELANEIRNKGLLMTAIGPNENTYKSNFLNRNKYIANISDIVVVIETNIKSGTMNTIRNASEAGKKILYIDQENEIINSMINELGGELINDFNI